MNSLKKLLLTKSIIAAAIASSGIAVPAISHAIPVGGPAAGMVCLAGYTPAFNGTALTCSKAGSFELTLVCSNPNFSFYTIRDGANNNFDLCTRTAGAISTSQSLAGLTESTNGTNGNYVFATFDPVAVAAKTVDKDAAEAAALSLTPGEVTTLQGTAVVKANGRLGGAGEVQVPLTFFTFAVPKPGIIIGGPIGFPATTSTTPFVPRALPR
jgi:hypothetical protein